MKKLIILFIVIVLLLTVAILANQNNVIDFGCIGPDCPTAQNGEGTPFPTLEPEINQILERP